jgi:hypothetical protein
MEFIPGHGRAVVQQVDPGAAETDLAGRDRQRDRCLMVCGPETLLKNAASQLGCVEANASRIVDHQGNSVGGARADVGPTSMPALNQTFSFKKLKGPADGDPGESELFAKAVF